MKYYLFLIIICIFFTLTGFSQKLETGTPFIQNITPREYGYESQNFCIEQDKRGLMYFGNLNGILQYDGTYWRLIEIPGIPHIKCGYDSIIYVGGYNDFGIITDHKSVKTNFKSLKQNKDLNIGAVNEIFSLKNDILFSTDLCIFRWTGKKIMLLDSIDYLSSIHQVNDAIYYKRKNGSLMRYKNFEIKSVSNTEFADEHYIKEILPYDKNKLLFYFSDIGKFYIYDHQTWEIFNTDIDIYLRQNKLSKGIILNNGNYLFGTERCGLVIIDDKGNFILHLNKAIGLNDDNITDVFVDNNDNLWVTMDNGIARIEYPSPWSFYSEEFGIRGGISSIITYQGLFYIATTQGIFYAHPFSEVNVNNLCSNHSHFFPITTITEECNSLTIINNQLIATTVNGVYRIKHDKAFKIIDGVVEKICVSNTYPGIIYASHNGGLSILKLNNEGFNLLGNLHNLNNDVRTIAEDVNGNLWLGSDYNGVYFVDFKNGLSLNAPVTNFYENNGLPKDHGWIDVYSTISGILFSTHKGAMRFNYETQTFYYDTLLGIDFSSNDRWVFPVVEDSKYNLWFSSGHNHKFEKQTAYAIFQGINNKYLLKTTPFNKINDITIESIFPDSNNVVWLGSFDGMIKYDPNIKIIETPVKTMIRKILIGNDSVFYMGDFSEISNDSVFPAFEYQYNNIHFEFSAPDYKSKGFIKYQYILENFDDEWSEWTEETNRDYTNLREGLYTFRVKAKNINGNICEEATFKFRIKPPLYRTWFAYLLYISLIITFIIMVFRWREYIFAQEKLKLEEIITEKTEEILRQKERAEELLANVLPPDTAKEIQSKGRASRKKYKMVTVLFSDIQGFTKIAEHMNPEKLLDDLDKFFLQFDEVVEKMGIEKIKTIGDAYMCAGGIPKKNRTNPIDVVLAGIIMKENMRKLKEESENDWDIRIGIHTGPVIAGVVGSKKISYDIWGDTVNIASRMESSGQVGEINISETTYELVAEFFDCEPRGKIPVKYKGDIYMYFVKGIKEELSENGDRVTPNKMFHRKLQYIRFDDLEEVIMHKLEKGLPKNLYYHNLKHTIDVVVEVEIIGLGENVTKEEMLLLKTAALLHDTGFLLGYENHEDQSIEFAKDILVEYKYDEEQIKIICDLINATKDNVVPQTKLEKIMKDADLDYLGRTDYIPVSQNLFRELFERNKIKSLEEWHKLQIKFIEKHVYYTETARKMREENKLKHLEQLKQMV